MSEEAYKAMRVMIAEYAVGSCDERRISLLREGRAMLHTLRKSFESLGHDVVSPYEEHDFADAVEKLSKKSDAGIVIAPDDILAELTAVVEENTLNLGCPSEAVRICADKLRTTEILRENGIPAPEIYDFRSSCHISNAHTNSKGTGEHRIVIKPRYGCGSEGVFVVRDICDVCGVLPPADQIPADQILTSYVEGDDVSVSMVAGASNALLLTVNKQHVNRYKVRNRDDVGDVGVEFKVEERLVFEGCSVPYTVEEIWLSALKRLSVRAAHVLGCRGYFGIDFVLGNDGNAYVVDVNPRATTALVCVARVLNIEIADLILRAARDELPAEDEICVCGKCTFRLSASPV